MRRFRPSRHGRSGIIAALLAQLVLGLHAGPFATRTAVDPTASPIVWGMNPAAELSDGRLDAADDRGLRAIAATGATELRYAAAWRTADPTGEAAHGRAAWSWTTMDGSVATAAKDGLRWDPFLCYPPDAVARAPTAPCGGPTDDQAGFAAFGAALVARYGPGGTFWATHPKLPARPLRSVTIWNEPNLVGSWPTAIGAPQMPEEYAALYARTRDAIAATRQGAAVKVVLAAPAPIPQSRVRPGEVSWDTYLRRVVAALNGGRIDAFEAHPYILGVDPSNPAKHTLDQVIWFRQLLEQIGRGTTPIAISELGVATSYAFLGDPATQPEASVTLTEDERARYYREVIPSLVASNCRISSVDPLFFSANPQRPALPAAGDATGLAEHLATVFAIAEPDGTLMPSGQAFANAVTAADFGYPQAGSVPICN